MSDDENILTVESLEETFRAMQSNVGRPPILFMSSQSVPKYNDILFGRIGMSSIHYDGFKFYYNPHIILKTLNKKLIKKLDFKGVTNILKMIGASTDSLLEVSNRDKMTKAEEAEWAAGLLIEIQKHYRKVEKKNEKILNIKP